MEITEKKTIDQDVVIGYQCDVCDKKASKKEKEDDWQFGSYGNSDYESDYTYIHVCSIKCFIKALEKGIKAIEGYDTGEVFDFRASFAKKLYEQLLSCSEIKVEETPQYIELKEKLDKAEKLIQRQNTDITDMTKRIYSYRNIASMLEVIKNTPL